MSNLIKCNALAASTIKDLRRYGADINSEINGITGNETFLYVDKHISLATTIGLFTLGFIGSNISCALFAGKFTTCKSILNSYIFLEYKLYTYEPIKISDMPALAKKGNRELDLWVLYYGPKPSGW